MEESGTTHVPVMTAQVLEYLNPRPVGIYVDGTAGGGGHSLALLQASAPTGRVISLDADQQVVHRLRRLLSAYGARAQVEHANFRDVTVVARRLGLEAVDGLLLDLGMSSDQVEAAERGFSLLRSGPLDMRFDRSHSLTAAQLVNELPESELADLIYRYGEEHRSRRFARAIVAARPLETSGELARVIERVAGPRGRTHPATRTFQALRIAVNDELEALSETLAQADGLLRGGGRLAVISFHSLEDRMVKQFLQRESKDCICPPQLPVCTCQHRATFRIVTRRPIAPSTAEVATNPRSRSAKLRVAERL